MSYFVPMYVINAKYFSQFITCIGDGVEPTKNSDMVMVPNQIALQWK